MEYLLQSSKTIYFQLQNFGVQEDYVFLNSYSSYSIDFSFLSNHINSSDLVLNAKIKVLTRATVSDSQVKKIGVFYFDDDNVTKRYVDIATKDEDYLVFDISSFLFSKKHTHKTLYLENKSYYSIKISSQSDNVMFLEYYKQDQLYSNPNTVSDSLFSYQYSYNYFSQQLLFSKTLLDRQLFYNLSFVHSSVSKDASYLFFPKGWNFNVLEYLTFEDNEPVKYINQNNEPCELEKLNGPSEDYYYTNNGSALVLLKEVNAGVTTYKLFNEISPAFKRFDANGRLIYYVDNIGNYFNVTYTSTEITITDSKGNVVLIELQSNPNEFRVKLNGSCFYYFTKNLTYNTLTAISEDGVHEDAFSYAYGYLYQAFVCDEHAFEFTMSGASIKRIIKAYDEEVLDLKLFKNQYLRVLITDRHEVTNYYQVDENINLYASGECDEDDLCLIARDNQSLLSENLCSLNNCKKRTYETGQGSTTFNFVSLVDNEKQFNLQYFSGDTFSIKNGRSYVLLVTLEKENDAVFNNDRYVRVELRKRNQNYEFETLETLYFDKSLKKQTAAKIFTANFNENSIQFCPTIFFKDSNNTVSEISITRFQIFEIKNTIQSTYWVNKLQNDGVYTNSNSIIETTDSLDWVKFDYISLIDLLQQNVTLKYSYRDLIRDYINVEKGFNFYWDKDNRRLIYRLYGTTSGFPIKNKMNTLGNNTIYAKKTIKKYVEIEGVDTPLYEFEYLKCITDPSDNQKYFYKYNLQVLGNDTYKTIKVYDLNFNLIREEDPQLHLVKNNVYNNSRLVETSTNNTQVSNSFLNKNTFSYDNKNRVNSITSLVQSSFEDTYTSYLNNYELVSKSTSPSGIETNYYYSSDLKHNTKIQINSLYNQSTYSNGLISEIETSDFSYSYDVGEYGLNDTFIFPNNINQISVLRLDDNDLIGLISNTENLTCVKSFNKYGKINFALEKWHDDTSYTQKAVFLYFDKKPDNINSITSQNESDVKSNHKLYKIIDTYSSRNTYLDYNDNDQITEYKSTDSSNVQLYKLNYTFDDFDRVDSKTFEINSSNKIEETYTYQSIFNNVVEEIDYSITGLISVGNSIQESIERNDFNLVEMIEHQNNGIRMLKSHFKMIFNYNSLSMEENNVANTYYNELIKRVDYHIQKQISPLTFNCVYDRSEHISYDSDGNINSIKHGDLTGPTNNTGSSYQYDDYGRLVLETNYDFGRTFTYSYDVNGNVTSIGGENLLNHLPFKHISLSYDSTYPDKLIGIGNKTITYDQDLNITGIGSDSSFSWSRGRLLSSAVVNNKSFSFEYNYDGIRTKKTNTTDNISYEYFLDGHRIIGEKITSSGVSSYITYLYGQNGIFGMTYNGVFYYFQKNILGDITRIYLGGNLVARYIYDAYGNFEVLDSSGNQITDMTNVAHINPFRYRGYYYDKDINLYYCNARYYSPYLRRWISPDRYQYIDFNHIGGLNLYAYCLDNPIMYRDEEGKIVFSLTAFLAAIGISFAIGFTISIVSQGAKYGWENLDWKSYLQATIDGIFAAGAAALAFTGIGAISAAGILGASSFTQYSIDSAFHSDFKWGDAIASFVIGACLGFINFSKINLLSPIINATSNGFTKTAAEGVTRITFNFIIYNILDNLEDYVIEDVFERIYRVLFGE